MNIIVYSLLASEWTPHFETELEIIKNHLDIGDNVTVIKCGFQLKTCIINPDHNLEKCLQCQSKAYDGLRRTGISPDKIFDLEKIEETKSIELPFFNNTQELKAYTYDGVDVGMGAASSLMTRTRVDEVNSHTHKVEIEQSIKMGIEIYLNFKRIIERHNPEIIYLFNGRFADERPAMRAAEKYGIKFYAHERGSGKDKYELYENTTSHNIKYYKKKVFEFWDSKKIPDNEKQAISEKWFEARRNGAEQSWVSFVTGQIKNKLPVNFNSNKRNVAIFNSSEDEMKAVEGWENPYFKDQADAIFHILEKFKNNSNIHFYLRVHPNLANLDNPQIKQISQLEYNNLTIIGGHEEIDSYALMEACNSIITFGSTMGIETVFWGRPSILVGHSMYENVGGLYIPSTEAEIYEFIMADLAPKDRMGAIKFGYWFSEYGIPYKYYEAFTLFRGDFMGKPLSYEFIGRMIFYKLKFRLNNGLGKKAYHFIKYRLGLEKLLFRKCYSLFYLFAYRVMKIVNR